MRAKLRLQPAASPVRLSSGRAAYHAAALEKLFASAAPPGQPRLFNWPSELFFSFLFLVEIAENGFVQKNVPEMFGLKEPYFWPNNEQT